MGRNEGMSKDRAREREKEGREKGLFLPLPGRAI
jgi:hypothetical protein